MRGHKRADTGVSTGVFEMVSQGVSERTRSAGLTMVTNRRCHGGTHRVLIDPLA